ncbi:hypothetical protein NQZ68_008717 [Dissostichus eleginoides]|nr:hypothetical protein NQZ68_008717 [Dissostichus eleginoides]
MDKASGLLTNRQPPPTALQCSHKGQTITERKTQACDQLFGDPEHTNPAYQNKEGQNSQVLCPSECFKAKCVIVFTRREAMIAAEDEDGGRCSSTMLTLTFHVLQWQKCKQCFLLQPHFRGELLATLTLHMCMHSERFAWTDRCLLNMDTLDRVSGGSLRLLVYADEE